MVARALVLRAAAVGALAGLVSFLFARIFAEPLVDQAIAYEEGRAEAEAALATAAGEHTHLEEGGEIISRAVQGNLGIGVGMILFGVAVGCFFGVAYCAAYGRAGGIRPRQLSLLVAAAGFLVLFAIPFLKYPTNPPAVGNGDTTATRSALYWTMMVVSVLAALAAVWLGQRLRARWGSWNATLLAGLGFVVVVGVVMAVLPPLGALAPNIDTAGPLLTETPKPLTDASGTIVYPGFDADLMYWFRLYSVGAQALLWGVLGVVFAPLAERVVNRAATAERAELESAG